MLTYPELINSSFEGYCIFWVCRMVTRMWPDLDHDPTHASKCHGYIHVSVQYRVRSGSPSELPCISAFQSHLLPVDTSNDDCSCTG